MALTVRHGKSASLNRLRWRRTGSGAAIGAFMNLIPGWHVERENAPAPARHAGGGRIAFPMEGRQSGKGPGKLG